MAHEPNLGHRDLEDIYPPQVPNRVRIIGSTLQE